MVKKRVLVVLALLPWSLVLAAILLLVGCGATGPSNADPSNAGMLTPSGAFSVRAAGVVPTAEHLRLIDAHWLTVQSCLGLSYQAHAFRFDLHANEGGPVIAFFVHASLGRIGGHYVPYQKIAVLGDLEFQEAWRHEMIHYLLDMTEGDPDASHSRGGKASAGSLGADWVRCQGVLGS